MLEVNRFDPGKWVESDRLIPTTLLPDDIPIHCKVMEREREVEHCIVGKFLRGHNYQIALILTSINFLNSGQNDEYNFLMTMGTHSMSMSL